MLFRSAIPLECGKWQKVELAHLGGRFVLSVDGREVSVPARLPATFMSSIAFGIPPQGSGMKPFKGRLRNLVFNHSK